MNRFKEEHGRYPDDGEFPYDTKNVCHSFIKDGKIQFLGDCTHALANQTVDLPDWEQDPPGFTPGLHGADTQF